MKPGVMFSLGGYAAVGLLRYTAATAFLTVVLLVISAAVIDWWASRGR